jgi:hypothetical protein
MAQCAFTPQMEFMTNAQKTINLVLATGITLLSACSSSDNVASPTPAEQAFWDAFHTSDYSSIPSVVGGLQTAYDSNPQDPSNTFLLAHSHFWRLAESGRDPSLGPQAAAEAQAAGRFFGEAFKLNPQDPRFLGWLGGLQVVAAAQTNDQGLRQQGLAMIDQGVAAYPEFNLFPKALAYQDLPASDPDFPKAAQAVFDLIDLCMTKPIDRSHPDYSPYFADMKAHAALGGHKAVCWNDDDTHPHAIEGTFLELGDLLVKQGELDTAKLVFSTIPAVDTYADWPYKDAVESRLSADLSSWGTTHPSIGNAPFNCTTCHAKH